MPAVPNDFPLRLKAARAYGGLKSQKALADAIDTEGAGSSNIKLWEAGTKSPRGLTAHAFIAAVAELTGISEDFLWGRESESEGLGAQLDRIEAKLDQLLARPVSRRVGDGSDLALPEDLRRDRSGGRSSQEPDRQAGNPQAADRPANGA